MVHIQSSTWETDKKMQPEKHHVGKDNKSGSDFKVVYDYDDPRYYENL
jgi:hypothetical protein